MGLFDILFRRQKPAAAETTKLEGKVPGEIHGRPRGHAATPENALKNLHRQFYVDPGTRQAILDVRTMDRVDGRVKKIHRMTSRAAAKGGIQLRAINQTKRLTQEWERFVKRLGLDRIDRLQDFVRALMMEGNLALQWVLDESDEVADVVRMPSETLLPIVTPAGRFQDVRRAYDQLDLALGGSQVIASFPLWQLTLARLDPDSYDDWGCLGRPYLDATRAVWKKLVMTEEDLVIRRHMRAPLRMSHTLEGATPEDLAAYKAEVEANQAQGNFRDYFMNKKGAVTALQGDAHLDEIADVAHLLDTFFAGAPAPKGLFGYASGLSRDILEDLKRDFFDELDALQDNTAFAIEVGFRLHLLLRGVNPDRFDFAVQFQERRTDTPNQRADLALKYQALGVPQEMVWDSAGLDSTEVRDAIEDAKANGDPYPNDGADGPPLPGEGAPAPRVSVTPGNAPKGESQTTISTRRSRT